MTTTDNTSALWHVQAAGWWLVWAGEAPNLVNITLKLNFCA